MHNLRCFLCVVHRPRPASTQAQRVPSCCSSSKPVPLENKQGQIRLSQSRVRRWSQTTHDAGSTGRVALARLWVRPVPRLPSSDGLFSPAAMRPSPLLMTRATTVLSRAAGAKSVSADQAPPLAALRCCRISSDALGLDPHHCGLAQLTPVRCGLQAHRARRSPSFCI
jgi:hypothetical protein